MDSDPTHHAPGPPDRPDPHHAGAYTLLLVIFFLSGVAGLVYQVVWTRRLFLTLGATSLAIATILTAFMSGLALGSLVAGRWVDRRKDHLRLYVALEAGIAAYGALTPWLFDVSELLFQAILARVDIALWPSFLLRFAMSFALLILPTSLMGATLPVLSRQVVEHLGHLGRRLGTLYGINTLGAATGVALTGFLLIGTLGLRGTTWFAAALNAFAALLAWGLDRALRDARVSPTSAVTPPPRSVSPAPPVPDVPSSRARIAGVMAIASLGGFASFLYELGWTRILTLILGGAVQAYSVMLATFLIGLALGSVLLSRWIDRSRDPFLLYAIIEGGVAVSALGVLPLFGELPWAYIRAFRAVGDSHAMLTTAGALLCFGVMIVPTLLIGVTFPILGSIYARDLGRLGRSIGEVYFVNTAGGIAGSFVGGFLLIPWLGTERTLIGASLVNASCAVLAAFLGTSPRHRQALTAGATLAVTGLLLVAHPLAPDLSVVELPRVSQSASAPESWPSAVREACPRCAEPCWAPEPPPPDNAPRPFRMLCTTCASAERARMQESLTAPRRFWDPRVISAGVYVYTRLYSATPDGRALRRRIDETPLLFYEEGLNAIVTVSTIASFPGNLSLQINGKTDASNLDDFPTEVLLAGLPLCIHPAPREVLVIGLGSGITAGAATRYEEVRQVDVLEIESAVARGALLFAENHGDVLPDPARRPPHPGHPKLRLLIRDARQHCAVTASRYDVIISEPSNPWMSGPSHLFTLEHFRNLRRAMKEDGLAVQWIHTYSMTPDLIYSVLKTFRAVFGHVLVLGYASNPGDLYLFGANHPIAFDLDRLTERMARPAIHRDFAGIGRPTAAHVLNAMSLTGEDLDRNLGLRPGREALADAVNRIPFNTDDYPFVEFEAPRQIHKQNSSTEVFQSLYRFCDTPFPPIGPDGAAARRKLGLHAPMASAFMSIGLLEKAIDVAEDGLRSVPDDNALRSLLAGYLLQRMARSPSPDLAHRIQTLTRAVAEHNASSPLPHLQLAELASLQKRHADAATHYAHAIELGQDTSGSRLAFGQALARAGRDAEAVVNLERALVLNPELLAAHAELTEALERLGFVDRAMDSLRRWINLESNANNARRLRDRLDRMRRGKEEAGTSREPPPAGR